MSEFKGTKGIWEARRIAGELNVIVKGTLQTRRSFTTYRPVVDDVGCKHDANLISAAPELLKCLQDLMSAIKDTVEGGVIHWKDVVEQENAAKQAIAKALGEKS